MAKWASTQRAAARQVVFSWLFSWIGAALPTEAGVVQLQVPLRFGAMQSLSTCFPPTCQEGLVDIPVFDGGRVPLQPLAAISS
eukprot:10093765-Alexandrium_andersonii.AAC.1